MASKAFASVAAREERLKELRARERDRMWESTQRRRTESEQSFPEPAQHSQYSKHIQTAPRASMEPFSHIQIIPQARGYHDDSEEGTSPVFRRPSFAHQIRSADMAGHQSGMATRTGTKAGGAPHAAPASLANLASGTTFAAAARAAELNAARANKQKAQEAASESEYEVPGLEPLTLGALKFTKARRGSRSKSWKTLNLSDLPDSSEDGNSSDNQARQRGSTMDRDDKRAITSTSYGISQMPATTPHNPTETSSQSHANVFSRAPFHSTGTTKWDPDAPSFKPAELHKSKVKENLPGLFQKDPLPGMSNMGSNAPTAATTARYIHTEDPFHEQMANNLPSAAFPGQKHSVPTVKGTMDFSFRFPHGQSMNAQSQPSHVKPAAVPAFSAHNPANSYHRDPKPYSSFSTLNKKAMLMENLNNVIESSKAEGKVPATTRTVLYDPVARQTDDQSQHSIHSYHPPSEPDSNNLRSSEPLPWKDRPVDIYTPNFQNGRDPPSFPPGLANGNEYMYRLAQPPKPVERSLDELQRWWTTDTRAQGLSRAHLDQIDQAQRHPTITPTRRSTTTTMDSFSSPASGRTGSSMAPIGSERSSTRVASAGSAAPSISNDGMAHLVKAVLVNLQSYVDGSDDADYFGRFARPPEWCIDKSPGGNDSYFGDWGSPPSRVGRDPRYRPTYHEGRFTVFEEMDRRGGRELVGRRLR